MPLSASSCMAGLMISCSSVPSSPSSPACGFRESTAIRGAPMPKSCFRERLKITSFSCINSLVMADAISLTGICPVTNATRKSSFIRIIKAFLPSPNFSSIYSVCPGKENSSDWMVCLLIGAVTMTSISPALYSSIAFSKAPRAALPASESGLENSTFTSSSVQFTTLKRSGAASDAEFTILKLVGKSNDLR